MWGEHRLGGKIWPSEESIRVPLVVRVPWQSASVPWRHDFGVEYLGESMYHDGGPPPFQALRSTRWLYVEYRNGWRELYDLRRDPYELRNVAAEASVGGLRQTLALRLHAFAGAG